MIFTERQIRVRKGVSTIDEPVILYRGDFEVELRFTIMETKFRFKSGVNLVDSEKASHAQLALLAPDGTNVFTEIGKCENGVAIFVLSKEMIDELSEVGKYSFQIRLFDYYRESRISIPPVEFGIEVREPVASEDHTNAVNQAMVGYSIAKTSILDEPVSKTFDVDGQYNKTDWETGDRISEGKLNKIEDAIDKINQNEINDVYELKTVINSNFNILQSIKADKKDVGAPLAVNSINDMLDHSKVYVNVTDGNWYSWDGLSWKKGGVYNSQGIDENSVTVKECDFFERYHNEYELTNKYLNNIGMVANSGGLFYNTGSYRTFMYSVQPNTTYRICVTNLPNRFMIQGTSELLNPNDVMSHTIDNPYPLKYFHGNFENLINNPVIELEIETHQDEITLIVYLGFDNTSTPTVYEIDTDARIKILPVKKSITHEEVTFINEATSLNLIECVGLTLSESEGLAYTVPVAYNNTLTYVSEVKPNTKYNIKVYNNNRFTIGLFNEHIDMARIPNLNADATLAGDPYYADIILISDNSLSEYEFTTDSNSKMVAIYVSNNKVGVTYDSSPEYYIDENIFIPSFNKYVKTLPIDDTVDKINFDYWVPPNQPDTWADTTMKSKKFLENFYDKYVGTHDDGYTVKKESIGLCGDNTLHIYKYIFEPKDYTRTIMLSSLMHANEVIGGFGLARFFYYIMEDYSINEFFEYMRKNVRIICLPVQNPNGFDAEPRRYGTPNVSSTNSQGVNVNNNFDSKIDRWIDLVPGDSDHPLPWGAKGEYPYSENETVLLVNTLKEYKYDIEFWIDCHTGEGWNQDVWYYYIEQDEIYAPKIIQLEPWLSDVWARKKNVNVSALRNRVVDAATSHKLRYAVTELGIPCSTLEYVPRRLGGNFNGSLDIWAYLLELSNLIIAGINTGDKTLKELQLEIYNQKLKREIENLEYFKNLIIDSEGNKFILKIENGELKVEQFKMY